MVWYYIATIILSAIFSLSFYLLYNKNPLFKKEINTIGIVANKELKYVSIIYSVIPIVNLMYCCVLVLTSLLVSIIMWSKKK